MSGNDVDPDNSKQYWGSRNWHSQPDNDVNNPKIRQIVGHHYLARINLLRLSITLDFEARYDFSAVRTLFVYRRKDDLATPMIMELINLQKDDRFMVVTDTTHHAPRPRYRSFLTIKSEQSREVTSTAPPRVCSVIFEVAYHVGALGNLTVKIVETSFQQSDLDLQSPQLHVLYDSVKPINPNNPSILVLLSTSPPIRNPHLAIPILNLRILPVSPKRKSCCESLPPQIISLIVRFALDDNWRSTLLGYSLVHKSWAHVLGLFFESFRPLLQERNPYKVEMKHVLRSIRCRPYYGDWVQSLTYNTLRDGGNDVQKWQSFLEIMQHTTNLRHLEMPAVPAELVEEAIPILCNLRGMREWFADLKSIDISAIRMIVSNWHQLEVLRASPVSYLSYSESKTKAWLASRHSLNLAANQVSLSAPSTGYKLSKLHLESVGGTNTEFRRFLTIIAPSITHITLVKCDFICDPGEEFALEEVMPDMKMLEHLEVDRSGVSALSISRKPPGQVRSSGETSTRSTIKIKRPLGTVSIDEIENAMRQTHWNSILLDGLNITPQVPLSRTLALKDVARERGVDFSLWSLRSSD